MKKVYSHRPNKKIINDIYLEILYNKDFKSMPTSRS